MKRYLLLLLLAAAPVSAQSVQTTTVTGTVHDFFGVPLRNAEYRILEVQRKGMIIPLTPPHHGYTDSLGALSFVLPRSNYATQDTTKFRIYINAPEYNKNGDRGVWLALPDTSTVTLSTLPRSTYTPPGVAVIVQNIGGGTASAYGDSIMVADSLARAALLAAASAYAQGDTIRPAAIGESTAGAGVPFIPDSNGELSVEFGQGSAGNYVWSDPYQFAFTGSAAVAPYGGIVFYGSKTQAREIVFSPDGTRGNADDVRIDADGNLRVSGRDIDSAATAALQQAALALTRADSARNAVIAAIEADIAELTGRLDTAGTYDRVYLYGQIGQLYDSLGTLLSLINTKVAADTAALTALLDAVYARSGGASVWTQGTDYVYRDGPVTIGGSTSPISQAVGVYIPRNVKQHPDSMLSAGELKARYFMVDTTSIYITDSLKVRVLQYNLPFAAYLAPNSHRMGSVEFEIYPRFLAQFGSVTDWMVVADTANDVVLHRLSFSITAGRQNYFTSSTSYHNGIVSTSSVPIRFVTPVYTNPSWSGTGIGTASYCILQSSINDWNREQKITLKVDFITTSSGNSTWWVKIANN